MAFKADANKIKRWREERHWSQEHLAELAGIGLRTIQRIENGEAASRETLMALAAAYNVDVLALCVDPDVEAGELARRRQSKGRAAVQLAFWVHLASYLFGMIIFAGISLGSGNFAMKWPMIWWTVAIAGHALPVILIEIVSRYKDSD